jgi:hypothetical protein
VACAGKKLRASFVFFVAVVQIACSGSGKSTDRSAFAPAGEGPYYRAASRSDTDSFDGLAVRAVTVVRRMVSMSSCLRRRRDGGKQHRSPKR